ncbi:MAG TPA: hypothetical protein VLW44_06625 [Streptosporangiaceae bacterium]|nr:hypothetical protein [Streptosporangiaceae bacterium]
MAGEASDEEAAWRDLIAQYSAPPAADGAAPWPVSEELPGAPHAPPSTPAGTPGSPGDPGSLGTSATPGAPGAPGAGEQAGTIDEDPDAAQTVPQDWGGPVPGVIPAPPQARIIRPAVPAPLPPAGDDEHYVPPAPPPLPRLDPVSKGAWVALFGGPGYLLLAVLLGWVVPSWAAFCAVAAFVGGFAALVIRMGDRPPGDSGPGDGAVV